MRVPIARRKEVQSVNRQREMQRSIAAIATNADAAVVCRCEVCGGHRVVVEWNEKVSIVTFSGAVFSAGGVTGVGALTLPH